MPEEEVWAEIAELSQKYGGRVEMCHDITDAVDGAAVVYAG